MVYPSFKIRVALNEGLTLNMVVDTETGVLTSVLTSCCFLHSHKASTTGDVRIPSQRQARRILARVCQTVSL